MKKHPHNVGFTLIELLVVISIIAVMIGILIPALTLVRDTARSPACQTQLQGIVTALDSYTKDNNDQLPPTPSTYSGSTDHTALFFNDYLPDNPATGIWVCPSHEAFDDSGSSTSSYGYNWQYLTEPATPGGAPYSGSLVLDQPGLRMTSPTDPTNTLAYADHHDSGDLWTYIQRPGDGASVNGMGRFDPRHSNRGNVAYLDGHVESESPEVGEASAEDEYWAAFR